MLAFTRGIGRLLVAVGLILGCLPEKSQAAEDNVFAGIAAEYHYRTEYKNMKGHKAFAIGPNGTFSAATQWDFDEDAVQFALYNCAHVDNRNVFRMSTHVCSVINVDDKDVAAP